jgi:hypothetical protein
MNVLLANLVCLFIPSKQKRREFREKLLEKEKRFHKLFLQQAIQPYEFNNPNDREILPNIKIMQIYHKPAKLFQHRILVPINSGRAVINKPKSTNSKGNIETVENNPIATKWLLDNMIGDDTGDNISHLNQILGENTVLYWVWKNYDKIGNPDYIGSCQYAKMFEFDVVAKIPNYDMIIPNMKKRNKCTIEEEFCGNHFPMTYQKTIEIIRELYPQQIDDVMGFFKGTELYYCGNIFIMRRELFFELCEWLIPILLELTRRLDIDDRTDYQQRQGAYMAERLISYFYIKRIEKGDIKYFEGEICNINF